MNRTALELKFKLEARTALIAVIGLGYVGLPVAIAFHAARYPVLGFDVDSHKVKHLVAGESYIGSIPSDLVRSVIATGNFNASSDFNRLSEADAIIICVPTPLGRHQEPDLSFVSATITTVAAHLKIGQLVCLESTTYPGTTEEILKPAIEASGFKVGSDVFLAYSPEREDPGNKEYTTRSIPKVVGADDPASLMLARLLYSAAVTEVVPVSSSRTAEAVKITENIYRAVNIALVNELKLIYEAMGIEIWEVIEAAKTKPFGFSAFYPGPGLGGHCVPIDPFYLSWKAREYDLNSRFIELAGEINRSMPGHVVSRVADALSTRQQIPLAKARILLVGVAYKKNIDDIRESPALNILEQLERKGAQVSYHDPFVPTIPTTRERPSLAGRQSIDFTPAALENFHAAIICADHDSVDWKTLLEAVPLLVDTRNIMSRTGLISDKIVRA